MGTTCRFTPETIDLLGQYIDCKSWQFLKKRRIRKKIYTLEVPKMRNIVKNNFNTIIQNLYESENSRIYVNTANYLLSNKKFSHRKFNGTINPRSLKNNIARYKYTKLFKLFINDNISVFKIEKKIRKLSIDERAFISYISNIDLEIFNLLQNKNKMR